MSLFMVCQTSVSESEAPATTFILTQAGKRPCERRHPLCFRAADADEQKGDSRPAPAALRRESGSQLRPADGDFSRRRRFTADF